MHTIKKMPLNKVKIILGLGILLFAVCSVLTGCQMQAQRDLGKMVPPGNQVAIKDGGPFDARFQTKDMSVSYQYWKAGDQLKARGTTRIRYESIKQLIFHLYFLDGQGKVIDIKNFFSFLDDSDFINDPSGDRHFHRDFAIPAGAVAFAIGYDGETGESKEENPITFSYFPFE